MFETVEVQDTVGGPFKSRTKLNTYKGTMAKLAEHLCDLLRGHESMRTLVEDDSDNEDDDGLSTSRCACFEELHLERATAVISLFITCFQYLFQFTTSSSCIYFLKYCMLH
jgi:hypothetical protein